MSSKPALDYRILWAKSKPLHPLWKHLLDAAAVSLALGRNLHPWSPELVALIVGLHDIGKSDSGFQHQNKDQNRELSNTLEQSGFPHTADSHCRHERISADFVRTTLAAEGLDRRLVDTIARAVSMHHGYFEEVPRPVALSYANAQIQLYSMLRKCLSIESITKSTPSDLSAFGMALAGHTVLSDWIASNESFFTDQRLSTIDDPREYLNTAQEVARGWVDSLGLAHDISAGKPASIVQIPRPLQQLLLEETIPPGLVIVEAPMGEGKTEAAWILAEKWRDAGYNGMYMALPTMATSDSLHQRYCDDYLKKTDPEATAHLVHGMAWLRDTKELAKTPETGEKDDDQFSPELWFRPTRRAMLAAHGIGTIDQAMLAGMNVKFGFLRLYGLADRVLVIDEVHAYDSYMSAIIARLLQWCACLGIPVIMLSATLSLQQRSAMLAAYGATGEYPDAEATYPLVTIARSGKPVRCLSSDASGNRTLSLVSHIGLLGNAQGTAALAESLVTEGGCLCVILNTVRQAQDVYSALNLPEHEKLLFHARFTAADRVTITNRVLQMFGKETARRPHRFILVATQVVEQSLDVDFDQMISEIAPIDLLLQRSGRMHRHRSRAHDPALHLLLPERGVRDFGSSGYVYYPKPLLRTLAILEVFQTVKLPEDFRQLIEQCYGSATWPQDVVDWSAIEEADWEWEKEAQLLSNKGIAFALEPPKTRSFRPVDNTPQGDDSDDGNGWRAMTRLGANDQTAVLVDGMELEALGGEYLSLDGSRELYRRTVKIPRYVPLEHPADGFLPRIKGDGKLKGLVIVPLNQAGEWRGTDGQGRCYHVSYHKQLGLMARRES